MATVTKSKQRTAKFGTLHDLLILKLQALHDVEAEIIKALPKMQKAATSAELKQAFETHLAETKAQEERIDKALTLLTGRKNKTKSEAIRGLTKDAAWLIKNVKGAEARDAALIAAAQYVEHYEIAGYGTAIAWAELMGHDEVVNLLQETLEEESATDKLLSSLAEREVNENVPSGMEDEREDS